jgi:ABC-2 type transport system ATP-binding protein
MEYIQVKDICKQFGKELVLKNVSVGFDKGKIHGIVGRNGCGKTVLLRIICGLYRATSGTVVVNGKRVGDEVEFPASTGILIENPGFVPYYSGQKNLRILADMSGHGRIKGEAIDRAIAQVGLPAHSRKSVAKYSLGMRQRLGIAQAIMEDPELLILDEPMNGLDNRGVADMRALFKELRAEGKTILLSSHDPFDIEELCDTVCEMDAGVISMVR